MNSPANVTIESLRDFKAALQVFGEDTTSGLASVRQEVNRTLGWLEQECPAYWRQQIRNCYDEVSEARTRLTSCQMRTVGGRRPDCIEEEQALRKAKHRLQYAEEKIQVVRRWVGKAQSASDEFTGRVGQLDRALAHDVPHMAALLEKMLAALDAYVSAGPSGESSSAGSTSASSDDE